MKHIHILGICGTFMGGLARLAREMGYTVSGCDQNVYPPMSTQLQEAGIELLPGYEVEHLRRCKPDEVIVGNALSRGNPVVEAVLNENVPYTSGPQWLYDHLLAGRWVLAVAGTHGKTTTAAMLAWILESAGMAPGFLIGGVPANFGLSARLGESDCFVIEADEYDTAFFDKRSKFLHYRPRTLILNNLEYDHADIFDDLEAIKRQFHQLLRTVPGRGRLVVSAGDEPLKDVLERGCWTPVEYCRLNGDGGTGDWCAGNVSADGSRFEVHYRGRRLGEVEWPLLGRHNVQNALSAIAAASHAGVLPETAIQSLAAFKSVKRRLEVRGTVGGVTVYDDFAHHPTAIETTLQGVRGRVGDGRLVAVLEPRSNSMRMGVHNDRLAASLAAADRAWIHRPEGMELSMTGGGQPAPRVCDSIEALLDALLADLRAGDHVVIMSNGDFGGLHAKLLERLQQA